MSLASSTNRNDYTGNGATDTYSYTFRIFEDADLLVTTVDTDGVETGLTLTNDYTVSGAGDAGGGSITLVAGNLTSSYGITIRRVRSLTQTTDIRNQGDFYPETHEDAFDHMVMISQQQQDELDRSAKNAETVSSSDFDPTLPADMVGEENVVLMTNAAGDAFATGPSAASISAATDYTLFRDYVEYDDTDSPVTLGVGTAGMLVLCDCSSGAITVNLPTISAMTVRGAIAFRKTDSTANALTIARGGSDTIESGTSTVINSHDTGMVLVNDGTSNWEVGGNWYGEANSHSLCRSYDSYDDTDSPITLSNDDAGKLILCDASSGAITVNLPELGNMSTVGGIAIKKSDTSVNAITINRGGTDTIDSGTSTTISSPDSTIMLVPNLAATDWANIGMQLGSDPILEGTGSVTLPKGTTAQRPSSGVAGMFRYNSDTTQFEGYSGAWGSIGGAAGGINYISNPDSEAGTTGWSDYADAAATTPVDGTGGAPTLAISRVTAAPLRDVGSFRLTKDAADRQGEGVSYDFSIDSADQARMLQVSFDYYTDDADFDATDITVHIYDVTNTELIAVTPSALDGGPDSYHKFSGVFQTAPDSTSYRLILHVATTNAAAWTWDFDNVQVGPQLAASKGVPVTDWIEFTPTGSWSTNVTYDGQYRRVGDSLDLKVKVTCSGNPDATAYLVDLPSGLMIDTTKMSATVTSGLTPINSHVAIGEIGVGNWQAEVRYHDANTLAIRYDTGLGTNSGVTQAAPCTFDNTDFVDVVASGIPIVGWGSSVVMSDTADSGRIVALQAYTQSTQALTNGNFDLVTGYVTLNDTHGAFSSNAYTVPVAGFYRVTATFLIGIPGTSAISIAGIYLNGSSAANGPRGTTDTSAAQGIAVSDTIECAAGDALDVRVYVGGVGHSLADGGAVASKLAIERISGPSQIAASEKVYCRYASSAAQTMANATSTTSEIVNFENKIVDSHNCVTIGATAWKFTAPKAGIYIVSSQVMSVPGAGWAEGEQWSIRLYKGGSTLVQYLANCWVQATHSTYMVAIGSTTIVLAAGEYIDLRIFQSSGGGVQTFAGNESVWVSISEV